MDPAQNSAGAWACCLLGHRCLLFRWRAAQQPAQNFAWQQKRIRVRLDLGSSQTQCSRVANTPLHEPDQAVARAVGVLAQPAGAANQQRRCVCACCAATYSSAKIGVRHALPTRDEPHPADHLNVVAVRDAGSCGLQLHHQRGAQLVRHMAASQLRARTYPHPSHLRLRPGRR